MKHNLTKTLSFIAIAIFCYSCSNHNKSNDSSSEQKVYGGQLKINETEKYKTLYPLSLTDVASADIASQIY